MLLGELQKGVRSQPVHPVRVQKQGGFPLFGFREALKNHKIKKHRVENFVDDRRNCFVDRNVQRFRVQRVVNEGPRERLGRDRRVQTRNRAGAESGVVFEHRHEENEVGIWGQGKLPIEERK